LVYWSTGISSAASNFSLDSHLKYFYGIAAMAIYSSQEVANLIGVSKRTLLQWLYDERLPEPKRIEHPGVEYRIWSEKDLERAKQYKAENYCKGRGRKPKKQA
jgi:hypothetical protein